MQAVFVCGGRGTRLAANGAEPRPKSMLTVAGGPLLGPLVDRFLPHHDADAPPVFVTAAADASVRDYVDGRVPGAVVVEQPRPSGVADALLLARPHLRGPCIVVLGDLVLRGAFAAPLPTEASVAVWTDAPAAATSENFGVRSHAGRVVALAEKPRDPSGWECGIGVYVLTTEVVEAFPGAPRDPGGERNITDALAYALAAGARLGVFAFRGDYVNVNSPRDLAAAEALLA